jgi:hypothetical protein
LMVMLVVPLSQGDGDDVGGTIKSR